MQDDLTKEVSVYVSVGRRMSKKEANVIFFIFGDDVSRTHTSIQTLQIYSKRRTELRFTL